MLLSDFWFQGTRTNWVSPGNPATPHVRGPRRPIQAEVAIDMDEKDNSHLLSEMNDKGLFLLNIALFSKNSSGQIMSDLLRYCSAFHQISIRKLEYVLCENRLLIASFRFSIAWDIN